MTALCDVLEQCGDDHFILHGRTADLVNIAGKRSSFGYLNAQLNAIPGVQDGVFFLRESDHGGITGIPRLARCRRRTDALGRDAHAASAAAHRSCVSAAAAGDRRAAAAQCDRQAAAASAAGTRRPTAPSDGANGDSPALAQKPVLKAARTLTIAADHPAFAGHFPGMPLLPGAALLDDRVACARGRSCIRPDRMADRHGQISGARASRRCARRRAFREHRCDSLRRSHRRPCRRRRHSGPVAKCP